jgi:Ser/Thr protein kinase RdoA (MazF antagonist)
MENKWLTADRAAAEQIIREHIYDIQETTYIDHGHHNLVVSVNRTHVFRFPRDENAVKRLQLETALLQRLKGKITALPIPEVISVSGSPFYVILKYLEGECLTADQIMSFSEAEQVAVGQTLATFIAQFNQAVDGTLLTRLRHEAGVEAIDEPWPVFFKRVFVDQQLPNDRLRPMVDEYYGTWKDYTATEEHTFAVHDDLHPANVLFIGPRISGVLDFGNAYVGSIEQEMRGLYRMGDTVLTAALNKYQQLTSKHIEPEHVRIWVVTSELAIYTHYFAKEQTTSPAFLRAQANLRKWIPGFPL